MKKYKISNLTKIIALVVIAALIIFFGMIIFNKKKNNESLVYSFNKIEKNKFEPCVEVNVLTYHHIQSDKEAKKKRQTGLSVSPENFKQHLQYLKDKNYTIIGLEDLISFFNETKRLSGKLAMITLDDAYKDNYLNAYPILKEFGFKATIFVPTDLVGKKNYLTWEQIDQMKDIIYFGNHTWSHHDSEGTKEELEKEIGLADKQIHQHWQNLLNVFAYPYGKSSDLAKKILTEKKYKIAFTTEKGNILCRDKNLELPRIGAKNEPLENLGL